MLITFSQKHEKYEVAVGKDDIGISLTPILTAAPKLVHLSVPQKLPPCESLALYLVH